MRTFILLKFSKVISTNVEEKAMTRPTRTISVRRGLTRSGRPRAARRETPKGGFAVFSMTNMKFINVSRKGRGLASANGPANDFALLVA
jgi:hypothetical protein